MINRLLRHPKVQNSKWVEYGFRTVIVGGIIVVVVMVLGDLGKAKQADKTVNDKKYCIGKFDTIPCHQLRIEHLLLESRQKELKGG